MMAPATPRPIRSTSTTASSGAVSHSDLRAQSHGEARHQRAEDDHPAGLGERLGRHAPIAVGRRRLPPPGGEQAGLRGERERQAWQIAHRPHGERPYQRRGERQQRRGEAPSASSVCQGATWLADAAAAAANTRNSRNAAATAAASDEQREATAPRPRTASAPALSGRTSAGHGLARGRCRPDSRADAGGARRRRSRERPARSSPSRCLRGTPARNGRWARREDQRERGERARGRHETGRRRSASFRLPRRYPCRSRLTYW